jgi:uncharacterized membrane protein
MDPAPTTKFYRRPYFTTITYAVGLLLFLLPFFDIKCNNITMARLRGIEMATGGKPSVSRELKDMQRGFGNEDQRSVQASIPKGEGHLFITALVALTLGVIGLILSLTNKSRNQRPNMIVGILGVVAMIGTWIEVSVFVSSNAKPKQSDYANDQFSTMVNIAASPTAWFILGLICYAAAAYVSYKLSQNTTLADTPPHNAPQLKIENPGEQSDFPAAPTTDEGQLG